MNLENINAAFVLARYNALKSKGASWNDRASDYEKLYLGDIWETDLEPGERRISAPIAFEQVESSRALLLTRPPVISVPVSAVKKVATERAEKIEKYLYGVWSQAQVLDALNLAEWHANCFGAGVLRCLYDEASADDDFPLLIQSLDPRNVFTNPTGRPGQDNEVIHAFERPRREIEAEWGISLGGSKQGAGHEDWLDQEVLFVDMWRADIEEVEEVEEAVEPRTPTGVLAPLLDIAKKALKAGAPKIEEPEEKITKKVRRRVVINCVVADGEVIKDPVKMPGYTRLPFIRYAGINTPLAGENGELSVLFPITGGTRQNGAIGLAAAVNELLVMKQQIIQKYANAALITDDPNFVVDFSPEATNYVAKGSTWKFLVPPGPHPSIDNQLQLVNRLIEDSTINVARRGSEALSGLALNVLNNPAIMKIAHRQQTRERAYQELNKLILSLTEEYAPVEGWSVWGNSLRDNGEEFEVSLRPEEIGGYRRNTVKLSASLPRDEPGQVLMLSKLVDSGLMSRETAMSRIQEIQAHANQSPGDEMRRVMRDKILFEGETAKRLAAEVLREYSVELAESLQPPPAPQTAPPPGAPPGMAGPPMAPGIPPGPPGMPPGPPNMPPGPPGTMQGMPPSLVPPGAMPELLSPEARMNLEAQEKIV